MSSIPSWAVRGARVVCIESFIYRNSVQREHAPVLPQKGTAYTIADVDICGSTGVVDLILVEIVTKPFRGEEIAWDIDHFRPLVTRTQEQDLAIFMPLLDHVPEVA